MVQKVEKFSSKGKVLCDFIDEMIKHGSQVIAVADEKTTQIAKLKLELDTKENIISEGEKEMKICLTFWSQMKEKKPGRLVKVGVIPDKEKQVEVRESLKHRIHVIKSLFEDVHQVQEDVEGHRAILVNGIEELSGKLLDDSHTFLPVSEITQIFKEAVMKQVEDEGFSKNFLHTICDFS